MDVGTVQSPAVNVTMPGQKAGTPVPAAESKPLAPMQVPIGANGPDSAAEPGGRPVGCFIPATIHASMAIQGFVMLRDPCLFLRNSHSPRETFGGINMDLSTVQSPVNLQNTGRTRHGCRNSAKPGCKRHNAGAKGRDAGSRSRIQAVSADGQVPIGANGNSAAPSRPIAGVTCSFHHPGIFRVHVLRDPCRGE